MNGVAIHDGCEVKLGPSLRNTNITAYNFFYTHIYKKKSHRIEMCDEVYNTFLLKTNGTSLF